MLFAILFILKLIGMILALIFGFVFLVLLLVLLVPIRYRVYFTYEEKLCGEVKVHWLLHIIHFNSSYMDDKLSVRMRILGMIIFDSNKGKKPKSNKKPKSTKKARSKKKAKDTNRDKSNKPVREENTVYISGEDNKQKDTTDTILLEKHQNKEELTQKKVDLQQEQQEQQHGYRQESKGIVWNKLKNVIRKIGKTISFLIGLPVEVKEFFSYFIHKMKKQTSQIKEMIEKVKLFIKDEVNKDSFFHIIKSLVQVLKHLNPKKLVVKVEFGLEDPAATGMLLGGLSALIGIHGKFLRLIPNFNEEVLKGEILAIGRVRIIRLLIIGIRLILYKSNRQLIKNFKTLKEEL